MRTSRVQDFKSFSLYIYDQYDHISTLGVMKYKVFLYLSLVIITLLSLSDICLAIEWRIFKEIKHFHDMNFIAKPLHKNFYPMDHKIYSFGRPAFGHLYYVRSTSMSDPVEKRNFKEIMHFHSITNTTIP